MRERPPLGPEGGGDASPSSRGGPASPSEPARERGGRPSPSKGGDLDARVALAVREAREFLFSVQREETHHWCAELESNAGITAEYVLMCQALGRDLSPKREGLIRFLRSQQHEDGSWGMAPSSDGDVSTTAETYLALRILGLELKDPALARGEAFIRGRGGLEKIRIFTRIFFAMFGLMPWGAVPAIPPEFILLPPESPVNIYSLSSWARGTMVPLFIIFHHRPVFALPNGRSAHNHWLDHLWLNPLDKRIPYSASLPQLVRKHRVSWRTLFGVADVFLKAYEKAKVGPLRGRALTKCTQWVLDHQEASGDWAGIFPPMVNGVIALTLQGYGQDSEPVRKGLEAIENFSWEDENGFRIQACVSPVWDTALSAIALVDSGRAGKSASDPKLKASMEWILGKQIRDENIGDWRIYRPELISGGWSFEYFNSWYPDIDDTAAVLLALLKQDPARAGTEPIRRCMDWTIGMQNRDGGWAAFDVDNNKLFLNEIPFSDMDSLCDPSSPDVAGRVLEAFGLLLELTKGDPKALPPADRQRLEQSCQRGVEYLRRSQESPGSWFGRWGVNYVYGTSNVLCGLSRVRVPGVDPTVLRGLQWLKQVQNADGGWGESLASYADPQWMGRGDSTASQTAWGVMGLLSYLPAHDPAVIRGIRWLVDRQVPARPERAFEGGKPVPVASGGTWDETAFTGTGFPSHFVLRYHYYRHYFPLMALGRFIQAQTH